MEPQLHDITLAYAGLNCWMTRKFYFCISKAIRHFQTNPLIRKGISFITHITAERMIEAIKVQSVREEFQFFMRTLLIYNSPIEKNLILIMMTSGQISLIVFANAILFTLCSV